MSSAWYAALALMGLDGKPLPADTLEGKTTLFVNVASRCGFTPQYQGLQALHAEFEARGLVLVGVPCNQFAGQEPGTAEEIRSFCSLNYGVTFPILEKQEVNGPQRSPLYRYLVDSPAGGGKNIKWNFEKFLVSATGEVKARFNSATEPSAPEVRAAITALLGG